MQPQLYFSRAAFCQDTFESMASGFDPHRSLFGPRRIGKSWFLLYDLLRKADTYSHKFIYVDFWSRGPAPLALLLYELDRALAKKGKVGQVLSQARDLAPRVKLSALGVEIELDLTSKPKTIPEDQILLLGQYLDALSNAKSPTFIVFDEFQEVARTPDHEALIAALRAALVRHAGGFATVFSGSSQSRLRKIFNSKSAPFYRFATPLSLPPLGIEFVRHQLGFYPKHGPEITEDEAMEIFKSFGTNPDYFQRWMRLRAVSPDQNAHEVAQQISGEIADEFDFEASWLDLADTHRLVLRLIASGLSAIYGDEAQSTIVDLGIADPPTTTQLQTAFKTLERRDLVDNWEGERQIADPMFRSWILSRPESDFQ